MNRYGRTILLLILLSFPSAPGSCVLAQDGAPGKESDFVSLLGRQSLERSDSVVLARVVARYSLVSGVTVCRVKVLETLFGVDPGMELSLMGGDPFVFPEVGLEVLAFAARSTSDNLWRLVGLFYTGDDLGRVKLGILRRILEIEKIPDRAERIEKLREQALGNVAHVDPWVAWNAAAELFNLVHTYGVILETAETDVLSDLVMHSNDDQFATYLQMILSRVRARTGDPSNTRRARGAFLSRQGDGTAPSRESPSSRTNPSAQAKISPLARDVQAFLASTDPEEACRHLHRIADRDRALATGTLLRGLAHSEPQVRATAATLLGHSSRASAVLSLVRALEGDPSLRVRQAAARSLGHLGGEDAILALEDNLEEPGLGLDCLAALGEIGSERTGQILRRELDRLPPGPSRTRTLVEDLLKKR